MYNAGRNVVLVKSGEIKLFVDTKSWCIRYISK